MKTTIRNGVARTAFVSSYADAIESRRCHACDAMEDGADLEQGEHIVLGKLWRGDICANCNREYPRAGSGEDWFDAASELGTPPEAFKFADEVLADFEKRNGVDLETLCANWEAATDQDTDRFAHYLAMQYLGHGVGLGDDVPNGSDYEPPETGSREFSAYHYDFAKVERRPRERLQAFDGEGCAVFIDSDGDAGAYAMREEGSGIGNQWAHGVGFEFYSSTASEVARIRAADTGEEDRPERIWAACERMEKESEARERAENS